MQEKYIDRGKGDPIVLLHGLMGAVSNFESTIQTLPDFGYRTILPMLPLYELPVLKTNVNELAKFVNKFMDKLKIKKYTIWRFITI